MRKEPGSRSPPALFCGQSSVDGFVGSRRRSRTLTKRVAGRMRRSLTVISSACGGSGHGLRGLRVLTMRSGLQICVGLAVLMCVAHPACAEPATADAAATPAATNEVSIPSAQRPAQIEPMVAPVKRVAPPVPVIRPDAKAVGKSAKAKSADDKKSAVRSPAKTAEKSADKSDIKKKR